MYVKNILVIFLMFLYIGCIELDDDKKVLHIGYLIDSAVSGVDYKTNSQEGVTSSNGSFNYKGDDSVITFKIGNISLGDYNLENIHDDKKIFPTDLAGKDRGDTRDVSVLRILTVLQTLDNDGDPSNNIVISNEIKEGLKNTSVNIFDTKINLQDRIFDQLNLTSKNVEDVLEHFESTLRKELNMDVDTIVQTPKLLNNIEFSEKDNTRVELFGEADSKIYIDGRYTNFKIESNGTKVLFLSTDAVIGKTNIFKIHLKDNNNNISSVLRLELAKRVATPPKFSNTNWEININERQIKVETIRATDSGNDTLYYYLQGIDSKYFNLNSNTGVLKFKSPRLYDQGGKNSYVVTIKVTDGIYDIVNNLTVNVLDVNDPPYFSFEPIVYVYENTTFVLNANGFDVEGDILFYSLKDGDHEIFSVDSSSGVITFKGTPDYEGSKNVFNFTVSINDGINTIDQGVTVNLLDTKQEDSDGDFIPDDIEDYLGMAKNNSDQNNNGVLDGNESGEHVSFGDSLFDTQWSIQNLGNVVNPGVLGNTTGYKGNDLNLMEVYKQYMGYNKGSPIIVQVVDTGVDIEHEDLKNNININLSRNSATSKAGNPEDTDIDSSDYGHGTMCAGIIAARAFNGVGIRGVAPFVKIAGSNWAKTSNSLELEKVWVGNDPEGKIAISSNSWSYENLSKDKIYEQLMQYASNNLRKVNGTPRGKIFVVSAGNLRYNSHDSGLSYLASNPYVITVGAINYKNKVTSYSSPGSNILVSAYGGDGIYYNSEMIYPAISSTFMSGKSVKYDEVAYERFDTNNINSIYCFKKNDSNTCITRLTWNNDINNNYTFSMNGTSASTPMVAGSIALLLEACPALNWRDVRYLIAKHSIKIDDTNPSWETNSAGYNHSVDYGYGLINPLGMINDCKNQYKKLPSQQTTKSSINPSNGSIPNTKNQSKKFILDINSDLIAEWVNIKLTSDHSNAKELEINLTSPAGTKTRLMLGNNVGDGSGIAGNEMNNFYEDGFRLGSVAFVGESSNGTWEVSIEDMDSDRNTGDVIEIELEIYGYQEEK